jgi:membrane-bound lytic murein transglycosylase D
MRSHRRLTPQQLRALRWAWLAVVGLGMVALALALWSERGTPAVAPHLATREVPAMVMGTPMAEGVAAHDAAPASPARTPDTRNRALPVTVPPGVVETPAATPEPAATSDTMAATTTTAPAGPPAPIRYRVQPGDTIFTIARAYGVSMAALITLNNLPASGEIRTGQELLIPGNP